MSNRRDFLQGTAAWGAGLFAAQRAAAESTAYYGKATAQVAARGGYLGVSSGSLSKVATHVESLRKVPVITTDRTAKAGRQRCYGRA